MVPVKIKFTNLIRSSSPLQKQRQINNIHDQQTLHHIIKSIPLTVKKDNYQFCNLSPDSKPIQLSQTKQGFYIQNSMKNIIQSQVDKRNNRSLSHCRQKGIQRGRKIEDNNVNDGFNNIDFQSSEDTDDIHSLKIKTPLENTLVNYENNKADESNDITIKYSSNTYIDNNNNNNMYLPIQNLQIDQNNIQNNLTSITQIISPSINNIIQIQSNMPRPSSSILKSFQKINQVSQEYQGSLDYYQKEFLSKNIQPDNPVKQKQQIFQKKIIYQYNGNRCLKSQENYRQKSEMPNIYQSDQDSLYNNLQNTSPLNNNNDSYNTNNNMNKTENKQNDDNKYDQQIESIQRDIKISKKYQLPLIIKTDFSFQVTPHSKSKDIIQLDNKKQSLSSLASPLAGKAKCKENLLNDKNYYTKNTSKQRKGKLLRKSKKSAKIKNNIDECKQQFDEINQRNSLIIQPSQEKPKSQTTIKLSPKKIILNNPNNSNLSDPTYDNSQIKIQDNNNIDIQQKYQLYKPQQILNNPSKPPNQQLTLQQNYNISYNRSYKLNIQTTSPHTSSEQYLLKQAQNTKDLNNQVDIKQTQIKETNETPSAIYSFLQQQPTLKSSQQSNIQVQTQSNTLQNQSINNSTSQGIKTCPSSFQPNYSENSFHQPSQQLKSKQDKLVQPYLSKDNSVQSSSSQQQQKNYPICNSMKNNDTLKIYYDLPPKYTNRIKFRKLQKMYFKPRPSFNLGNLILIHFDGVLGIYDQPFFDYLKSSDPLLSELDDINFQKQNIYFEQYKFQEYHNKNQQDSDNECIFKEQQLKIIQNLSQTLKKISEWYFIILILPSRSQLWIKIRNYLISQYFCDGIYTYDNQDYEVNDISTLKSTNSSYETTKQNNKFFSNQNTTPSLFKSNLDNSCNKRGFGGGGDINFSFHQNNFVKENDSTNTSFNNNTNQSSLDLELLLDYNQIIQDLKMNQPKKVLIIDTLPLSMRECFTQIEDRTSVLQNEQKQEDFIHNISFLRLRQKVWRTLQLKFPKIKCHKSALKVVFLPSLHYEKQKLSSKSISFQQVLLEEIAMEFKEEITESRYIARNKQRWFYLNLEDIFVELENQKLKECFARHMKAGQTELIQKVFSTSQSNKQEPDNQISDFNIKQKIYKSISQNSKILEYIAKELEKQQQQAIEQFQNNCNQNNSNANNSVIGNNLINQSTKRFSQALQNNLNHLIDNLVNKNSKIIKQFQSNKDDFIQAEKADKIYQTFYDKNNLSKSKQQQQDQIEKELDLYIARKYKSSFLFYFSNLQNSFQIILFCFFAFLI